MTGEKFFGFSGGMSGAAGALVELGFETDDVSPRNPDWNEDEQAPALNLYQGVGLKARWARRAIPSWRKPIATPTGSS